MELLIDILHASVSAAFSKSGYRADYGLVTLSNRPDLCEYQCSGAFAAARENKKSPAVLAKEVGKVLLECPHIKNLSIAGNGFLNFDVENQFLLSFLDEMFKEGHLGVPQAAREETILLDYGGPNVAKPLHIGHMRSAIIGDSLKRIVRATGRKAIGDVHLGDWGVPMGLVMAELLERNPHWLHENGNTPSPVFALTAEELNVLYPYASKKSKTDMAFLEKAKTLTRMLQKGHPGCRALWQEILRVSTADMRRIYSRLNVEFEDWFGESDSEPYIPKLLDILHEKGLLRESEGALVVEVANASDKAPVPPVIIKKSDDASIYATTDLATILLRQKKRTPSQHWYIVDVRQSLHFTQVFRCARLAELLPPSAKLVHLGFGTMNGANGKPYKTRDGGVMPLSEFFEMAYERAYRRGKSSDERERAAIAKKTAVAALRFGDLMNHRLRDYVFDLDKFMASEGKTGAFLLYTVARINSLMRKAGIDLWRWEKPREIGPGERELWQRLAISGGAVSAAFEEQAPNLICENVYQLALSFSRFYHDYRILNEENIGLRLGRLNLCGAVREVLQNQLGLLGIETVEIL